MSEDSTGVQDDDYLVRVRAQVMTRDDSSGGWVPISGGGPSIVVLRKHALSLVNNDESVRNEYSIRGQKITDQSLILNCSLKKDVLYTKATPTFHHWKTDDRRFGLTFTSAADARAFDKGVRRAIDDLLGSPNSSNSLEVGDDDVFMPIELPIRRQDSSSQSAQSASTTSTTTSSPTPHSPARQDQTPPPINFHEHLQKVHYISKTHTKGGSGGISSDESSKEEIWMPMPQHQLNTKPDHGIDDNAIKSENSPYVQFQKTRQSVHEYQYPALENLKRKDHRGSISSLKKYNTSSMHGHGYHPPPPPLPTKGKTSGKSNRSQYLLHKRLLKCRYCEGTYTEQDNSRGSCQQAPDRGDEIINKVTCMCCAEPILYHCFKDENGQYGHPCICDSSDRKNCRKWTVLTVLSFFIPCLWCYVPLKMCHQCGKRCGCCGGRHRPV